MPTRPIMLRWPGMKNPWLRKNPWLSLWLSAANTFLGAARGQAASAIGRQRAAMQRRLSPRPARRRRKRP